MKELFVIAIVAKGLFASVAYSIPLPERTTEQLDAEFEDMMQKEGLSYEKLETNPTIDDLQKMRAIMRSFLQRKDLNSDFMLEILPGYYAISILLANNSSDLDTLHTELKELILIHPHVKDKLTKILTPFENGSDALFSNTRALRELLKGKITKKEDVSIERQKKIERENSEIYEAIRLNKAVVSITNPTIEEFIRRRDTLAPFLERKDFEHETIYELVKQYNLCAIAAAKSKQDLDESKKRLEVIAKNYPQLKDYIKSVIIMNYGSLK